MTYRDWLKVDDYIKCRCVYCRRSDRVYRIIHIHDQNDVAQDPGYYAYRLDGDPHVLVWSPSNQRHSDWGETDRNFDFISFDYAELVYDECEIPL